MTRHAATGRSDAPIAAAYELAHPYVVRFVRSDGELERTFAQTNDPAKAFGYLRDAQTTPGIGRAWVIDLRDGMVMTDASERPAIDEYSDAHTIYAIAAVHGLLTDEIVRQLPFWRENANDPNATECFRTYYRAVADEAEQELQIRRHRVEVQAAPVDMALATALRSAA